MRAHATRANCTRTLHQHTLAALLLATMGWLLLASMSDESPTSDEPWHLTRGLAFYWGTGASLSYAHPPLGNAFAALPIVLREPAIDLTQFDGYEAGEVERVAAELLTPNYETRRKWFFEGRSMIAGLSVALGAYFYAFARTLFGPTVALVTLFFYALHPTIIAHGRLVTTDLPATASMVCSLCELLLYVQWRSRWHVLSAGLLLGVALATKHTGLLLLPLLATILLAAAAFGVGRYSCGRSARRLAHASIILVLLALLGGLVVNAAYGFQRTGMRVRDMLELPEPVNPITAGYQGQLLEQRSILRFLPSGMRIPLPYTYLYGVTSIQAHDARGHSTVFFGRRQEHGSSAYFPVLLAIKTPALHLAGLAGGLVVLWRRRRVNVTTALIVAYCAGFLLVATRSSINIGARHVLPIVPWLSILAAQGAVAVYRAAETMRLRPHLVTCLVVAHVWGATWSFPDYLSDFNALVGGRRGGQRISIVGEEWGQDIGRLGSAVRSLGVSHLQFDAKPFTSRLELERLGIEVRNFECKHAAASHAFVAVSARDRARDTQGCYSWLGDRQPLIDIHGHIWVFGPDDATQRRLRHRQD